MNKLILRIANKKIKQLLNVYSDFNVIFLDNWRGFRFIYDCGDAKKYPGKKFLRSRLYKILKYEKSGKFTAGLFKASKSDKKIFGPQYFLNCKTYRQYANCYINFFLKRVRTSRQARDEAALLDNMKIMYAKKGNLQKLEDNFKGLVIKAVIKRITNKEVKNELCDRLEKRKKRREMGGEDWASSAERGYARIRRSDALV